MAASAGSDIPSVLTDYDQYDKSLAWSKTQISKKASGPCVKLMF